MNNDENNERLKDNLSVAVNAEMLDRYGEAATQYKIAYDGVDNSIGKQFHQGLKSISKGKINPEYANQNINQQAGYSAEVLDTADQNAEYIKNGSSKRASRTDDAGSVNDMKHDQITLDEFGNVVDGSGVQIKFLKDSDSFVKKVSGKEYAEHYPDGKFKVPKDQYNDIKNKLDNEIQALENQINLSEDKLRKLEYLKKVRQNLQKSSVAKNESIFARKHPKAATVQRIAKTSVEAGAKAAAGGAIAGGGISIVQNISAILSGDKDGAEAAADVAKDTVKAGAESFVQGTGSTALASVMRNSGSAIVRKLGQANAPTYIVQSAVTVGKMLVKYCNGEITGEQFFAETGKSAATLAVAAKGAVVGQALIPIPGAGAIVGSLVSTLLCNTLFDFAEKMNTTNREIMEFTEQIKQETQRLKAYQAMLLNIDLDRFERETRDFNAVGTFAGQEHTQEEFELMLQITYKYMGIPDPLNGMSIDDFIESGEVLVL